MVNKGRFLWGEQKSVHVCRRAPNDGNRSKITVKQLHAVAVVGSKTFLLEYNINTSSNQRLGSAFGRMFCMTLHTNTKTRCTTTRSKAPEETWRGGQSAVFTRRISKFPPVHRDRNEIRMRSRSSNAIVMMIVINPLVFSKLFYCSSVWSNAATTHLLKLQAVQNFAARMVSNTRKFDHVTPVLKELRWLPVNRNCTIVTLCSLSNA